MFSFKWSLKTGPLEKARIFTENSYYLLQTILYASYFESSRCSHNYYSGIAETDRETRGSLFQVLETSLKLP